MSGLFGLVGAKALVAGVANDRSIARGVARALRAAGAERAIAFANEKAEAFVRPHAEAIDAPIIARLDLEKEEDEDSLFERPSERSRLDILARSVAHAPRENLRGPPLDASHVGLARAMDVCVLASRGARSAKGPVMQVDGGRHILGRFPACGEKRR